VGGEGDKEVLAVVSTVLFVYAHEKTGGANLLKCFHLNNIFV
jgi:hypothetical protein